MDIHSGSGWAAAAAAVSHLVRDPSSLASTPPRLLLDWHPIRTASREKVKERKKEIETMTDLALILFQAQQKRGEEPPSQELICAKRKKKKKKKFCFAGHSSRRKSVQAATQQCPRQRHSLREKERRLPGSLSFRAAGPKK